jgi:SAM-dependent methyltransferase
MTKAAYDRIGQGYTSTRRPDPRIAAAILNALGDARSVVNVGSGAGAYEPADRPVVAVEPSWRMIRQRSAGTSVVVQASAEGLPFHAGQFDAGLAVLTLHHWTDWRRGLSEMRRVAGRLVILTYDPREFAEFWLTATYFPEIVGFDRGRCPSIATLEDYLGQCRVDTLAIPHDCVDGFLGAFWRRPAAYLDPEIRAGMSAFALMEPSVVDRGIARLKADLESGEWDRRFGHLRALESWDGCYRILVADQYED